MDDPVFNRLAKQSPWTAWMIRNRTRLILSLIFLPLRLVSGMSSTFLGLLLLLLIAYFTIPLMGGTVLTASETVEFFASLGSDALLTIAGLVGAYALAVGTWRSQRAADLTIEAVALIENFYYRASQLSREIESGADSLLELQALGASGNRVPDWKVQFDRAHVVRALAAQQELSDMNVASHELYGRTEMAICRSAAAGMAMQRAMGSLEKLTQGMRFIAPDAELSDAEFMRYLCIWDTTAAKNFVEYATAETVKMAMNVAIVKAAHLKKILRPTVGSLANLAMQQIVLTGESRPKKDA